VQTIFSTRAAIREWVTKADLVIGAVLVPGASAPKLITREMLGTMKPGAVLVDIAIDQGGCAERRSRPPFGSDLCGRRRRALLRRQHAGRGGATSTFALNNATLRSRWRWPTRAGARR